MAAVPAPAPAPEPEPKIKPNATYSVTKVGLRIAADESGDSGLLKALSEAFITYHSEKTKTLGFFIEWYQADTNTTIEYIKDGTVDAGITYNAFAEKLALDDKIIDKVVYAWRTWSMLVGPSSNPLSISSDHDGIENGYVRFARLFSALQASSKTDNVIKFLSRYDKSTLNTTESKIWAAIGQIPWAGEESTWYHEFHGSAADALAKAAELGEYTITDKKAWCDVDDSVRSKLASFAQAKEGFEDDPLLNPAHLVVGSNAKNKDLANAFAEWLVLQDGGQPIIDQFSIKGNTLYSPRPEGVDPLGQAVSLVNEGASPEAEVQTHRTAVRVTLADHDDQIYFFQDRLYLRIDTARDINTNQGARGVAEVWSGLSAIGWDTIDAWLPIPGTNNAYAFRDDQYIDYDETNDRVLEGPSPWAKKWPSLAQAGFKKIDTVLPWIVDDPKASNSAWFFSGNRCTRIHVDNGTIEVVADDIATHWPVLKEVGFDKLDVALLKPSTDGAEAWFFVGDYYAYVDLKNGKNLGEGAMRTTDKWQSLAQYNFFTSTNPPPQPPPVQRRPFLADA